MQATESTDEFSETEFSDADIGQLESDSFDHASVAEQPVDPNKAKRDSKKSSSRSRSSSRRKKSSTPSAGFEVFKVALGALMAPPVAQLVIWWGLGLDPLGLGPTVANVVPAVVPSQFHGENQLPLNLKNEEICTK